MQAVHMSYKEETLRLRLKCRELSQENSRQQIYLQKLRPTVKDLREKNKQIISDNKKLQKENKILKTKQEKLTQEIESLKLIVEELRLMIFGKGKSKNKNGGNDNSEGSLEKLTGSDNKTRKKANRLRSSYRRAKPDDKDVTSTKKHTLTNCPDCGSLLKQLKLIHRYTEDIEELSKLHKKLKKITKHIITTGYCSKCKKRQSAIDIQPQVSCLGENVKKLIAYLAIIMRLSYEQIQSLVKDLTGIKISDGEIAIVLQKQAKKLKPEKDRLFNRIRGQPGVHYDETGWKVQKEEQGNYAWVATGTKGKEAVFLFGQSRGKGNAKKLQGKTDSHIGISDNYGAYKNMFKLHQLCCAHPNRKLRDLKNSVSLSTDRQKICAKTHNAFGELYKDLRRTLAIKYNKNKWLKKREKYIIRLKDLSEIKPGEPLKLKTIKKELNTNAKKYFTCLLKPGIPADNNKAERCLRHVVLKRKMSFGSKTQKGADTMAILSSTMLSKWWDKPENFFEAYDKMLA